MTDQPITHKSAQVTISNVSRLLETITTNGVKCDWSGYAMLSYNRGSDYLKFCWNVDWSRLKVDDSDELSGHIIVSSPENAFSLTKIDVRGTEGICKVEKEVACHVQQDCYSAVFEYDVITIDDVEHEEAMRIPEPGSTMEQVYQRKLEKIETTDRRLTEINLSGCSGKIGISISNANLKTLKMANCQLKSLEDLPFLPNLNILGLRENQLCGNSLAVLHSMTPRIASLDISKNKFGLRDLTPLQLLPKLEELELKENEGDGLGFSAYRVDVLDLLPKLRLLDGSLNEKGTADADGDESTPETSDMSTYEDAGDDDKEIEE